MNGFSPNLVFEVVFAYITVASGIGRILVREGSGEGTVPPPPQKIFDYLILKWRIFDAHLRYSDVLILKVCFAT